MSQVIPIHDFVLLKKVEKESAIVLPESLQGVDKGLFRFEVVAIGRRCRQVKEGDIVITTIARSVGAFEGLDGWMHYIVKEEDVCAVIR